MFQTAALSEDAFLMTPGTPRRDYNFLYQEFEEMETKLKAANQKVEELHVSRFIASCGPMLTFRCRSDVLSWKRSCGTRLSSSALS